MRKNTLAILFSFICTLSFGQAEWRVLENAPSGLGRFDDIFFITNDIGWAANGPSGQVYKTTDGGESWDFQFEVSGSYFRNIEFLDENVGFLGTLDGNFYKTVDGGENWNTVTITPNPPAICGMDAVNTTTIYGCGAYFSPAFIIKSVDGGETWDYIDMSAYASTLVEILFVDDLFGYASGTANTGEGVILETSDGGGTWTPVFNSGGQGDYVWKLQLMENNTHIFGSVQSNSEGKLIKSFDSGATWETKIFPDYAVQAVGFVSPTHGWMGGHNSGFYETLDGGDTWTDMGLGGSLNRFFFINENLAYCSGNTIYKYDMILSNPVIEDMTRRDIEITIVPVPVVDKLNIDVIFQHTDNLVIDLYNLNGQLIKRLSRDQMPNAGKRSYSFDFPYPAGTYLLDFHSNNGRRSVTVVK